MEHINRALSRSTQVSHFSFHRPSSAGGSIFHGRAVEPEYDEYTSPQARMLAIRYGSMWLERVFSDRESENPLRMAQIQHASGLEEILPGIAALPLQAGCSVFHTGCKLIEVHPAAPKEIYYLPGWTEDWGYSSDDYMHLTFSAPARLFLMLTVGDTEPRWLRDIFAKCRDSFGHEIVLKVEQSSSFLDRAFAFLANKPGLGTGAGMQLWRSRKVYGKGEEVVLPGFGPAEVTDSVYVVGFRREEEDGTVKAVGGLHRTPTAPGAAGALFEGDASDFGTWFSRLVKAVKRNRVDHVRALLKSEAWTSRNPRVDSVSFLPITEEAVLTVDLAVQAHSLELLVLLVHDCRCLLSQRALRFLVHKWEEVPPGEYGGGATGLVLGYVRRNRGPLAVVSCVLMALRAEIRLRDRLGKSVMEMQAVLARFQRLQASLLDALSDLQRLSEEERLKRKLPSIQEVLDPDSLRRRHGPGAAAGTGAAAGAGGAAAAGTGAGSGDKHHHNHHLTVSDVSPLRVAFEDADVSFMASSVVESYTQTKWCGLVLSALTRSEGSGQLQLTDPSFAHTLLMRAGYAPDDPSSSGGFLDRLCRLWHLCLFCTRAFFDSPRGRWYMRLFCTLFYLTMFIQIIITTTGSTSYAANTSVIDSTSSDGSSATATTSTSATSSNATTNSTTTYDASMLLYNTTTDGSNTTAALGGGAGGGGAPGGSPGGADIPAGMAAFATLITMFMMFGLGNIIEAVDVIVLRFKSDANKYLNRHKTLVVFMFGDCIMFAMAMIILLHIYQVVVLDDDLFANMVLTWITTSVLIWARVLNVIIPLFGRIGPMLNTMSKMAAEVVAFALPFLIITAAFAIVMFTVFQPFADLDDSLAVFGDFQLTLLTLFSAFLGAFDFTVFDQLPDKYAKYGRIVLSLYLVVSAVLLANLLIAIISYKYRPDEVQAQSLFGLAEIVDRHQFQVDHHLLCSPLNFLQLPFMWLPAGTRARMQTATAYRLGLPPLDGFPPAIPAALASVPTGRDALPYLVYLLTLHPAIMAVTIVGFIAYAPFAVTYHALVGHKRVLRNIVPRSDMQ